MYYTRWRKVLQDLWGNKTRTVLMVLTILVGVFSVGLVNNLSLMMTTDMDADYNSANPSEAKIYASPMDESWVRSLRKVEGVGELEGRSQVTLKWVRTGELPITMQIASIGEQSKQRVNILKPADPQTGYIPELGLHEIAFDRSTTTLTTLTVGEEITLELPGGATRTLHFVGYVHDATAFPYAMGGAVVAFVSPETAQWLGATAGYNELLLSVAENPTDREHVTAVVKRVTERLEKGGATVYGTFMYNPGHHFAWQITQGVVFILGLFGWMTVVLSGFLIVNTIVALMSQHTRQIGIMKAIGADDGQIFPMYLALVLSFGGLAFALAAPLSSQVAGLFMNFMGVFLNFDVAAPRLFSEVVVLQALVAFLTPLAAAVVPLFNGLRISVREALSSYGLGGAQAGGSSESRLGFIARPVLVSLRNAFRRKARVSLTIFTLILGGAIFIGVFNLWASFDQVMEDIQGYFLADVNVVMDQPYSFAEMKRVAEAVPGVDYVEGWMSARGKLLSVDGETEDEIAFVAPPANSLSIRASVVQGRWLAPGDKNAIVIGNHLQAIRPDLQVGDWVTIKMNGKKTRWQIIGFYRIPGNISPPLVYANYEQVAYEVGLTGKIYELHVMTYTHDGGAQNMVSSELQRVFKQRKISVTLAQTAAEWYAQQKGQTDVLVYNMFVMAGLIALVGALGLTSTMSLNVMERTREIGVMRAIGASDGDIQRIVIVEGLVIGVLSWFFAVLLSIPITYVLNLGVGVSIFQSPLTPVFDWQGSLVWLIGMLILAALASAVPAWRASRLSVRETLVYE